MTHPVKGTGIYESSPSTSGLSCSKTSCIVPACISSLSSESDSDVKSTSDEDFQWSYSLEKRRKTEEIQQNTSQMRIPLTHTAKAADLTGISNRNMAKIVTAVLEDMDLVSAANPVKVVDKNKIRREVERNRKQVRDSDLTYSSCIEGLYFDGRKYQTMKQQGGRRVVVAEEHIALIKEPGSKYLGHVSLAPHTKAIDILNGITSFIKENNINTTKLAVIGCDGTNVNTGWKGGAIRLLETHFKKPLQWSICLLHANELPLRHLLQLLDGDTKGPYTFSGPIGSRLADCEKLPVVQFKSMEIELLELDKKDLSTDQQYLYLICQTITSGTCSESLASRNPGQMSHARWLTTANRILRLYISTKEPTECFLLLVEFITKVYAPLWFKIKSKPYIQYGARHLWDTIRVSRHFPDNIITIIDKVIAGNAYFAHSENLLTAMLVDERPHIRELALRRILKARQNKPNNVRIFKVPKINFAATDYTELIDWTHNVTEPPLTMHISDEDLHLMIRRQEAPTLKKFPCHTQAVERAVKIITEASFTVCGAQSRDGFIRTKLQARADLPSFENKGQYYSAKLN